MERFGEYALLKELEHTPLGHVWRAGRAGVKGRDAVVQLVVFDGAAVDKQDLFFHLDKEKGMLAALRSQQLARIVDSGQVKGTPFVALEHLPGRSLYTIFARSQADGFPLPTDHALFIAQRAAAALELAHRTKFEGGRVVHGFLVPPFVAVTTDGEVKMSGFGLGGALLKGVGKPELEAFAPYLAPEQSGGVGTPEGDVYSLGALLFELLTSTRLPPSSETDTVAERLSDSELAVDGSPLPDDIRQLLVTALAPSPEHRFNNGAALKKDLDRLIGQGNYAPTTFNLAFFMHNLFREDIEQETNEIRGEEGMDFAAKPAAAPEPRPAPAAGPAAAAVAPLDAPEPAAPRTRRSSPPVPSFGAAEAKHSAEMQPVLGGMQPERSNTGMIAGIAAGVLVLLGVGGYFMFGRAKPSASPAPATGTSAAATPAPATAADIAATTELAAATSPSPTATLSPEEQKRLFDAEVRKRVDEAMAKLRAEEEARIKAQRAATAPPPQVAGVSPAPSPSPGRGIESPAPPVERGGSAPSPTPVASVASPSAAPAVASPAPPPPPRDAALVETALADTPPKILTTVLPEYPPIARAKRIGGTVELSVSIDETGKVTDVRVLKGAGGAVGLNEAAMKAVRQWTFKPQVENGKKVKGTLRIPLNFAP